MNLGSDVIEGVLPYIAPEVLRKFPYTKKSDVYSIGIIMWELATGKRPFSNEKHDSILAVSIVNGDRPPISEDIPSLYVETMKNCWNSDPDKRPDSSQLIETFETLILVFKNDSLPNNVNFTLISDPTKPQINKGKI